MAPQPKPPGQTRRRNLDRPTWTTLTQTDAADEIPPFPGRKPAAAALHYWEAIWSSPIAAMYIQADHPALARICRLHGRALANELAELRLLEQLYGLSPKARRALQWEVERAAGAGAAHDLQATDELQARRDGRRERLEG